MSWTKFSRLAVGGLPTSRAVMTSGRDVGQVERGLVGDDDRYVEQLRPTRACAANPGATRLARGAARAKLANELLARHAREFGVRSPSDKPSSPSTFCVSSSRPSERSRRST
jgi:hypothetical protein